jgi:D-glycero-D-manno-heptose 1,7-bisphosphate phosphatase
VTGRRAAFLDRDGTIIEDTGFVRDPAKVALRPGAAEAIAALRTGGFLVIVVTNQSGIARGHFGWNEYRAVAARLDALLAAAGASLDATYVCPHHPEFTGPCDCRKPGLRLYQDAERDFGLDLSRSIWIGDRARDVAAAEAFGGEGILIGPAGGGSAGTAGAVSLAEAVEAVTGRR